MNRAKPPRLMLSFFLVLATGYLLLVIVVYVYQPHLLFLPDLPGRTIEQTPKAISLAYEDVNLQTDDGITLHGWWISHPNSKGTILFFHGNAGNISHRLQTLRLFHELGYRVLIIDYRGYGQSRGTPSEKGLYADAEATWHYLAEHHGLEPGQIIIAGRSLGAAVALYLAVQHPPRALIMESSFTSVPDMAAIHYPWLPVRWLSRYQFDNRERITRLRSPLLIVHGEQDEIAPYNQGLELYELASSPKQLLSLQGSHNTAQLYDYRTYREGLKQFLERD